MELKQRQGSNTHTIPGLRTALLIQRLACYKVSAIFNLHEVLESIANTKYEAARTAEDGASTEYDGTENDAENTEYSPAMMVNDDLDVAEHESSETSTPVQKKGMPR